MDGRAHAARTPRTGVQPRTHREAAVCFCFPQSAALRTDQCARQPTARRPAARFEYCRRSAHRAARGACDGVHVRQGAVLRRVRRAPPASPRTALRCAHHCGSMLGAVQYADGVCPWGYLPGVIMLGGRTVRSMASKSANYCGTSRERNEGILLLRSGRPGRPAYTPIGPSHRWCDCSSRALWCEGSPAELGTATRSIAEIAPWALVRGSPVAFGRCVRAPLCRTADGLPRRGPSRGGEPHRKAQCACGMIRVASTISCGAMCSRRSVRLWSRSEVALGDAYVLKQANSDLPRGMPRDKQSVMGEGKTRPDPAMLHVAADGVKVPLGANALLGSARLGSAHCSGWARGAAALHSLLAARE